MYTFIIILIFLASLLVVLAVLAQNPKGGMAANFGASNAVVGVRQTADFLEKFTWGLAVAIVVLSLAATMAIDRSEIDRSNTELQQAIIERTAPTSMPDFSAPVSSEPLPAAIPQPISEQPEQ